MKLARIAALAAVSLAATQAFAADLKVGVISSLSGPVSALGIPYEKGIRAALAQQPTIAGYKVELIVLDDASDPTTAGRNARKLVTEDKVDVLIGTSGVPGALPYLALAERGYKGQIYGTHGLINADFVRVGGKSIEGLQVPSGPVLVAEQLDAANPIRKVSMDFRAAYQKAHGAAPVDAFSSYTYDAYLLLANAAARAKGEPGTPAYRSSLRDAINSTKELVGTHGIYNFKPDNRYGSDERAVVIVRMEKGQWKLVP
ncbi:ABC transporter substrate-binding protein [Variovorax sp.]|uniref:ABC transporter substrate-binding protein n=1 Tax=Variovorax sp. TaxID=1871043 RepID=UPI0013857DB1|nr:ABC transporter substrate-binding protein [Variovorax sp.]KAF1070592.1 MAG: hypothetical protein GAK39_01873 [Variovorax sp.]